MRLLCMDVPSKMVRLGLTQIDLIIQIYYFLCGFCDFCEILLFFSQIAQNRRCLTMLNRWQAHKGAACGEVASIIMCLEVAQHCSTSSTPNDSEVSAPRRLRYRSTSG